MPTGYPLGPYRISDPKAFFFFELDKFFGFIKATIFAPPGLDPPVLPFKTKKGNLLFPNGKFTGFFFSEELKLAKEEGYIILCQEYIKFTPNYNLFKNFIKNTYEKRMSYPKNTPENLFYKIIMLSIYGRFALNPHNESFVTTKENFFIKKFSTDESKFLKYLHSEDYMSHDIITTIDNQKVFTIKLKDRRKLFNSKGAPTISSSRAHSLKIAPHKKIFL